MTTTKRSVKHNTGTHSMVGIPIKSDKERLIIKKIDMMLLEKGEYPHRKAYLMTLLAKEVNIPYDWKTDG